MATATKQAVKQTALKEPVPGQIVDIRHMVRNLGPESINVANSQITSYEEAETHLKVNYFEQGWDLYETVNLGTAKGNEMGGLRYNTVTMLYILVKRAA